MSDITIAPYIREVNIPTNVSKRKTNTIKANRHKLRVIENTKRILDNISICKVYLPIKDGRNSAVWRKDSRIKVSQSLAWALDNIRVKWEVVCSVLHRTQAGEHFVEFIEIKATNECLSFDISEYAQNACANLFNSANKLTRMCPLWLAVPRTNEGKLIDLSLISKTIHLYNGLNLIDTTFEINVNKPKVDYHTDKYWFNLDIIFKPLDLIDPDAMLEPPTENCMIPISAND